MTVSLGQQLKHIREAIGISLEEIAHKTHIQLNYLQAIEAGDEEALPSTIQMRGFLRLYANELGVKIADLEVQGYHLSAVNRSPTPKIEEEEKKEEAPTPAEKTPESVEQRLEPEPEIDQTDIAFKDKMEEGYLKGQDIDLSSQAVSSTEFFETVGITLRNRRELLSLSITDIQENIHIREKYLFAMEEGRFDQLPSPVQTRGMLQIYAEFLNLDVDSILLKYADGLQARHLEKKRETVVQGKSKAKELSRTGLQLKKFFSIDLLVITALFLVFTGFVIWGANRIMGVNPTGPEVTKLPEVSDVLLATGSPTPQESPTFEATLEETLESTQVEEESTPIFTPLPNNNPINLVIIPRQQVWVQVTSDTRLVYEGRLLPGNAYDYSGNEQIEVLISNAGAVQVYFNEEDIGALGLSGQIADLIFTRSGLILPTATNTPTITETPEATPTPTMTPFNTLSSTPTTP